MNHSQPVCWPAHLQQSIRHKAMWAFLALCNGLLLPSLVNAATPALPQRDLTVEVRQVMESRDDAVHYQSGSSQAPVLQSSKLQVRNGEKAALRMEQSVPMQWTSSVQTQTLQGGSASTGTSTGNSTGTTAANAATVNAATQSMHWFDVGQSLSVQVRWPGGNKDAQVELEVQQSDMQDNPGGQLPAQRRQHVSTTVTAPLAQWVTVAASGGEAVRQGSYSSEAGTTARRLLQIRVLVP